MSVKATGEKVEIEVQGRFCDFCNQPMSYDHGLDYSAYMSFDFGFHSNRDGEKWEWDACNKCTEPIVKFLEAMRKPKD